MAKTHKKTLKRSMKSASRKVQVTLGDLIAAAFEATGRNAKAAARLVASQSLSTSMDRKIVFV